MLGKVFIHLDPRPFALTVEPSDVIQGVDEGLDIPAALPQPLDRIGELLSSGSVILEQPIPFLAELHHVTIGAVEGVSPGLETSRIQSPSNPIGSQKVV